MGKEITLDYVAGFVDADGYISYRSNFSKRDKATYYAPHVDITNCHKTSLEIIRDFLLETEGINCSMLTLRTTKPNHRIAFRLAFGCKQSARLIELLQSKLIVKEKMAGLVLEAYKNKSKEPVNARDNYEVFE